MDYIDISDQICKKYVEVNSHIEKSNPGSEQDFDQINSIFGDLMGKDEKAFAEVEKIQKELAKEHHLELEDKKGKK